jgi:mRNA interferase MazF
MTRYTFGDILIVDFPFTNLAGSKRRPAVVLAHDLEDDVLVARITSKARESVTDVPLMDWRLSKLLFPSTVAVGK